MSAVCDNQNLESSNMEQITNSDIKNVLDLFSKSTYYAKYEDDEASQILLRCINLMKLDYRVSLINNSKGELCPNYPSQLPILEYENATNQNGNTGQSPQRTTNTIYERICDVNKISSVVKRSKLARCRMRFPVPTILYKGKYICRSSTIAGGKEIYGRQGFDYIFPSGDATQRNTEEESDTYSSDDDTPPTQSDWQLFNKVRSQDIKLLKRLNVGTIIDLMVEKKKVKYGMYMSSSEKVDKKNRYSEFNIVGLPYPGCEFFKDFRDNNFEAEGLVFDWSQEQCNATISVPDNSISRSLKIEWNNYKEWDLVTMTKNYIKYLLRCLQDNSSSILVHCISGWDRTPLFISMLRLSLWADGLVHQSLNEHQILYLTIAYDWMLFGHHLCNRLDKGEEIFFFCFYVLKHLASDDFSIAFERHKLKKHTDKVAKESANQQVSSSSLDLLFEQDFRGSSSSLNSVGSSVSSKSQEPPVLNTTDESNGNVAPGPGSELHDNLACGASGSTQIRRTSPVTVPTIVQKQTESSATNNSAQNTPSNWNLVTATGSLKGSDSTGSSASSSFLNASNDTTVDGAEEPRMPITCRKERLEKVRELFYRCYFSSIGADIKYGPDSMLGAILGNIAERVGFTQRTESN